MSDIRSFEGKYHFLSNFYILKTPIYYAGKPYPTSEHLFQALKTLDGKQREMVRTAESPGDAKRMGKQVTLRPRWDEIKMDVMRLALKLKFAQPELRAMLIETGTAGLSEGNTHGDAYWGYDLKRRAGMNNLGWLLIELRSAINNGQAVWEGLGYCIMCDHSRRAKAPGYVGCGYWAQHGDSENDLPEEIRQVGAYGWVLLGRRPEDNIGNGTADSGLVTNDQIVMPERGKCGQYTAKK